MLPAVVQDAPPDVQALGAPWYAAGRGPPRRLDSMWVESSSPPPTPTAVSPLALAPPPPPAAPLPPLPPPLPPLPAGAVDADARRTLPMRLKTIRRYRNQRGRTRRDCRKCGRFLGWGKWYDEWEWPRVMTKAKTKMAFQSAADVLDAWATTCWLARCPCSTR